MLQIEQVMKYGLYWSVFNTRYPTLIYDSVFQYKREVWKHQLDYKCTVD